MCSKARSISSSHHRVSHSEALFTCWVVYAMATGGEPASVLKAVFLAGIVVCVIGLKFVKTIPAER